MAVTSGILSPNANFEDRLATSLEEMTRTVEHLKGLGYKVVLTSGSFDLIHLGHVKYLARAREFGDVLAVGVAWLSLVASPAAVREVKTLSEVCLLYTSPSPRDRTRSRMPSSA